MYANSDGFLDVFQTSERGQDKINIIEHDPLKFLLICL